MMGARLVAAFPFGTASPSAREKALPKSNIQKIYRIAQKHVAMHKSLRYVSLVKWFTRLSKPFVRTRSISRQANRRS